MDVEEALGSISVASVEGRYLLLYLPAPGRYRLLEGLNWFNRSVVVGISVLVEVLVVIEEDVVLIL